MAPSLESSQLSLKLVIDKKTQKLLFAESDKEFVDFLFNLLNLPLATVTRLVTASKMSGSVGNLYGSVEKLDESYMESNQVKGLLLKPALLPKYAIPPLPTKADLSVPAYYTCAAHILHGYYSDDPDTKCVYCPKKMNEQMQYKGEGAKYIKGSVTFIVTDDLMVEPLSMDLYMSLLSKAGVKDMSALELKVVHIGKEERLKLLTEAMKSKDVLTNVFVRNMQVTVQKCVEPEVAGFKYPKF